jgi:hypothetical protein
VIGEGERRQRRRATVLDAMEGVVRDAGMHLAGITTTSSVDDADYYYDAIDPKVAISFVILVERRRRRRRHRPSSSPAADGATPGGGSATVMPDFADFHEYFLDFEDRLLDECDGYWEEEEEEVQEEEEEEDEDGDGREDGILPPLGCEITVAAFHPRWRFSRDGGDIDDGADRAVDYEKRAPHPTISIVMSSAIDALTRDDGWEEDGGDGGGGAGEVVVVAAVVDDDDDDGPVLPRPSPGGPDVPPSAPATRRIAARNEETLGGIGVEGLRALFDSEVIMCPVNPRYP